MKLLTLKLLLAIVLFIVGCRSIPEREKTTVAAVETPYLTVSDITGELSVERIRNLANTAQKALENIVRYWSTDPKIDKFGKIRLEFYGPLKIDGREISTSVFFWKLGIRVVRAWGANKEPQGMVHKLTHAVFPHPDKLIRNMMGIPMEAQFGNYLSFPMCGFSIDAWVLALRQVNLYIPLSELGPYHDEWGMSTKGGLPIVVNFGRQQASYAEAGSFGAYLVNTYGIEKVKAFGEPPILRTRPWEEVFGITLDALEKSWIQNLNSKYKDEKKNVLILKKLLEHNPNRARFNAQDLAAKAHQ
jgi:hypothetical protein